MKRAMGSFLFASLLFTLASAQAPCPKPPEGKPTWFDTCKYLVPGGDVKLGPPASTKDPEYPDAARRKKTQGTVIVAVALNAQGSIDDVKVVQSLDPELDQASINAVKQWKFNPATKDGKPVAVQFQVETQFRTY